MCRNIFVVTSSAGIWDAAKPRIIFPKMSTVQSKPVLSKLNPCLRIETYTRVTTSRSFTPLLPCCLEGLPASLFLAKCPLLP